MTPIEVYDIIHQELEAPLRLTLFSGASIILQNPRLTLIAGLSLYIGVTDDPDAVIGERLKIVSIPNIKLIEQLDNPVISRRPDADTENRRHGQSLGALKRKSRDPDIINSFKALKRASRNARKLSIETGTPFYVMKDGKIVDLNRGLKRRKAKR